MIKSKYKRSISLPKNDAYNGKKVISSLFTQEEMEKLQNLFIEKYNGESNLEIFLNKINEFEKGNNIENIDLNMLNDECMEMEK